jgi:hypothetical protein
MLAVIATGAAYGLSINLDGAVPPASLHEIARVWHLFVALSAVTYAAYLPICGSRYQTAFKSALALLAIGPGINWLIFFATSGEMHARGLDLSGGLSLAVLATNGLGVVLLTWVAWSQK